MHLFLDHAVRTPENRLGWAITCKRGWAMVRFVGDPQATVCLPHGDLRTVYPDSIPLQERWA